MLCPCKWVYLSITLLQNYEANSRDRLLCELFPNFRVILHHNTVVKTPLGLFLCQQEAHILRLNYYRFNISPIEVLAVFLLVFNQHLDL